MTGIYSSCEYWLPEGYFRGEEKTEMKERTNHTSTKEKEPTLHKRKWHLRISLRPNCLKSLHFLILNLFHTNIDWKGHCVNEIGEHVENNLVTNVTIISDEIPLWQPQHYLLNFPSIQIS